MELTFGQLAVALIVIYVSYYYLMGGSVENFWGWGWGWNGPMYTYYPHIWTPYPHYRRRFRWPYRYYWW
jgi:hypothetical protein